MPPVGQSRAGQDPSARPCSALPVTDLQGTATAAMERPGGPPPQHPVLAPSRQQRAGGAGRYRWSSPAPLLGTKPAGWGPPPHSGTRTLPCLSLFPPLPPAAASRFGDVPARRGTSEQEGAQAGTPPRPPQLRPGCAARPAQAAAAAWPPAPTLMVVSSNRVAAASLSRVAVSGYCPLRNSARGSGCNQPLRWGDPPSARGVGQVLTAQPPSWRHRTFLQGLRLLAGEDRPAAVLGARRELPAGRGAPGRALGPRSTSRTSFRGRAAARGMRDGGGGERGGCGDRKGEGAWDCARGDAREGQAGGSEGQ